MSANVYGMTSTGFKPKRLRDLLDETMADIRAITDEDGQAVFINETDDSIIGQFNAIVCEQLADCWQQAYAASTQFDPLNAFGVALRSLVQLNGIVPAYGSATKINVTLTGTSGTVVPAGSQISDVNANTIFSLNSDVVIGSAGTGTGVATCNTLGEINPANNTIIQVLTPVYGWHNVTNTSVAVLGDDPETDNQLHIKQQRETSNTSYSQVDALYAGITNLAGVDYVRIYQNWTLETDDKGIPAKTIAAVVDGGDTEAIANVMWLKAPMLSNYAGNLEHPVTMFDRFGLAYQITFYRPEKVPVYIDLDITITDASIYPADAYDQIKQNIIDYAAYGLNSSNGFPPGSPVIYSRLYTPINEVPGFKINHLYIGTSASPTGTSDLEMSWLQVAEFTADNINIEQSVGA